MAEPVRIETRRRDAGGHAEPPRRQGLLLQLIALTIIPILAYAVFSASGTWVQLLRLQQQGNLVRGEIDSEKRDNLRLQEELNRARGDAAIEEVARRQLYLVKSGDHPVVLTGPPARAVPTVAASSTSRGSEGALPAWLSWLLERFGT